MLVVVDEILEVVAKAEREDPDGCRELLRFALYETLVDLADEVRPFYERDLAEHVAKVNTDARRVLVKEYMAKRAAGEDTTEVAKAAEYLTAVDVHFSKAPYQFRPDDPSTRYYDGRVRGRFAAANAGRQQMLNGETVEQRGEGADVVGRFAEQGVNRAMDFTNASRYQRIGMVGAGLAAIDHPATRTLGIAAGVVGATGDEAERVLGPGIRRTAYRYRGTEKKADASVVRSVKEAGVAAANLSSDDLDTAEGARNSVTGAATGGQNAAGRSGFRPGARAAEITPAAGIAAFYSRSGQADSFTPDQLALAMKGDAAAAYLRTKLPSEQQTIISIASGRVPPSQGVMIDADGDVVSEAMGFNGDHYLPFDLKNLKRLNGGQYVRTRAKGGPTSEDIYTALLTGTRQLQVVSHSGVFTLEFDPSLRGGKRYSDKAHQMVNRYARILDAIDKGGLYQDDVPAGRQRELRRQALKDAGNNRERADERFKVLLENERVEASYGMDDDELEAEAQEMLQRDIKARPARYSNMTRSALNAEKNGILDDLRTEASEQRVKAFRLDGEGYKAALDTLREEFPYFIRDTRHLPLPDFLESRGLSRPNDPRPPRSGGPDSGYVRPGDTNARASLPSTKRGQNAEGYYAPEASTRLRVAGRDGKMPGAPVAAASTGSTGGTEEAKSSVPRSRGTGYNVPNLKAGPSFGQMANDPEMKGAAARLFGRVMELAVQKFESPRDIESTSADNVAERIKRASKSFHALDYIDQAFPNTEEAMGFLLNPDTDEQVVAKVIEAVTSAVDAPATWTKSEIKQDEADAYRGEMDEFARMLQVRSPFGEEGTRENVLKGQVPSKARALKFADVEELGLEPANYDAYIAHNGAELGPVISAYETKSNKDIAADIAAEASVVAEIHAWGKSDSDERPQLSNIPADVDKQKAKWELKEDYDGRTKLLERKQRAFSYLTARRITEDFLEHRGTPGPENFGRVKSSATQAPPPFPDGRQRSRVIKVHSPDSALVAEVAKALLARQRRGTSSRRQASRTR